MKIDTQTLETAIMRGARAAYECEHPWAWPDHASYNPDATTFEGWLSKWVRVASAPGSAQWVAQVALWCERAYAGDSRVNMRDMSAADRDAIIVARHAFNAIASLSEVADGS